MALFASILVPSSVWAMRYHVHPAGNDNSTGLTWATALANPQTAINADNATEVWVAAGVYTPTEMVYDNQTRNHAFYLRDAVAVYGGFSDTGTPAWEERDGSLYPTILSGDLDDNDNDTNANGIIEPALGEAVVGDNSFHVIFNYCKSTSLSTNAILDGFVITGGLANGAFPHDRGGGIDNNQDADPTIRNCVLIGNYATRGGAVVNQNGAQPRIIACRFESNTAERGGAMSCCPRQPFRNACSATTTPRVMAVPSVISNPMPLSVAAPLTPTPQTTKAARYSMIAARP